MLFGIGLDLTEIPRIEKAYLKRKTFPEKILTRSEMELFANMHGQRQMEFLAGRFAAKEAFSKAMGTGLGKTVGFQDIETLWDYLGHPVTTSTKYDGRIFPSISHDNHEIVTFVVLEDPE